MGVKEGPCDGVVKMMDSLVSGRLGVLSALSYETQPFDFELAPLSEPHLPPRFALRIKQERGKQCITLAHGRKRRKRGVGS